MPKVTIKTTIVMTFESKMPKMLLQWWLKNRGNMHNIDKFTESQIKDFMNSTGHAFPDFDMSRGASDIMLTELTLAQPSNINNIAEVNTTVSVDGIGIIDDERWIISPEEKQSLREVALKHEYDRLSKVRASTKPLQALSKELLKTYCRCCGSIILKPHTMCMRCATQMSTNMCTKCGGLVFGDEIACKHCKT